MATAFVRPRKLLILDEPEQRLDTEGVSWLATKLKAERQQGLAIVFASHEPSLVELAAWADLDPMSTTVHFDDQHRWTGLDVQLRGTEQLACGRVGSIEVSLRGTWNR